MAPSFGMKASLSLPPFLTLVEIKNFIASEVSVNGYNERARDDCRKPGKLKRGGNKAMHLFRLQETASHLEGGSFIRYESSAFASTFFHQKGFNDQLESFAFTF